MMEALAVGAFVTGLLGSPHCAVMCGGVVGAFSATPVTLTRNAREARLARLVRLVVYNAGRVGSYVLAGAAAGALGGTLDRLPGLDRTQITLRFLAGIAMILAGLSFMGGLRGVATLERVAAPLWRRLGPLARRLLRSSSLFASFGLGALWGWMPCGLVYGALGLAVANGSSIGGAATMLAFGLGTLPMLLALGGLADSIAAAARRVWVRRIAASILVAWGIFHVGSAAAAMQHPAASHACCAHRRT